MINYSIYYSCIVLRLFTKISKIILIHQYASSKYSFQSFIYRIKLPAKASTSENNLNRNSWLLANLSSTIIYIKGSFSLKTNYT